VLHLLPADELDQHDTHPDRRCPCGGHLELVDAGDHIGWEFIHNAFDKGTEEGDSA